MDEVKVAASWIATVCFTLSLGAYFGDDLGRTGLFILVTGATTIVLFVIKQLLFFGVWCFIYGFAAFLMGGGTLKYTLFSNSPSYRSKKRNEFLLLIK